MKTTKKQRERIIENIYDIILQTDFKKEARKEMKKDLKNKNISLDKSAGTIKIQDNNGVLTQYTITIK